MLEDIIGEYFLSEAPQIPSSTGDFVNRKYLLGALSSFLNLEAKHGRNKCWLRSLSTTLLTRFSISNLVDICMYIICILLGWPIQIKNQTLQDKIKVV